MKYLNFWILLSLLITTKLFQAVALQLSGILGAGIFVLPYVFHQSNFSFAVFGLIFIAFIIAQINLFYIDIICATKGDHQLSGYAQIYLGRRFKTLSLINLFLLGLGLFVVYTKLAAGFLLVIFPGISFVSAVLLFLFTIGLFHLTRFEIFSAYYKIIPVVVIIFIFVLLSISLQLPVSPGEFTPPSVGFFGPLVFALTGFTIIPEIEELLRLQKRKTAKVKLASNLGLIASSFLYLFFAFAVTKISGPLISPDAVTGLTKAIPSLGLILALIGLLLVFEASLNYLLVLKETFYRDFHRPNSLSYLLSYLVFLLPLFFIRTPLVSIMSVTGSVTLFISALLICLIRLKINRPPLILLRAFLILVVFFLGLITEFT